MQVFLRSSLLSLYLLVCIFSASTQSLKPQGTFEKQQNVITGGYSFWLYKPADYIDDDHDFPLIIFLHGASLCGRNLNKVRRYGVLDAIDRGKVIPTLVVAPQNPGGAWSPSKLNDLLEWMKSHYRVDSTRVYVLGMSLGGYGTMDFVGSYPDKIAAAMAFCGGCSLKNQDGLGRVPLWIMHGTADRAVSINESKKVVEYLQEKDMDHLLRYDWMQGGGHGAPARLFYLQKTYDWLFYHSLKDSPREIDRSFDITPEDIKTTYQELRALPHMYDKD